MASIWRRICFALVLTTFLIGTSTGQTTFSITDYGAKADGSSDCSEAFLKAWDAACKAGGTLQVPSGKFLTRTVLFKGPCKGNVAFKTAGTVLAPEGLGSFSSQYWIVFERVKGLNMIGGTFDAQGRSSWSKNQCQGARKCNVLPTSIQFSYVEDSTIEGIKSIDSKMFHIMVYACKDLHMKKITIKAPADSPNTDGIHIALSTNVDINGAHIGTGDDCISVGPSNKGISVTKVICGPGHGISIGSLGKDSSEKDVSDVSVKDCTLAGTTNGVRVKTWKRSSSLTAKNFTFSGITMKDVSNPIIIDQEYCPKGNCGQQPPSKVKVEDMKFENIQGTSSTPVAVNLKCSEAVPCKGVVLKDIHLTRAGGGKATAECANVKVSEDGASVPNQCA